MISGWRSKSAAAAWPRVKGPASGVPAIQSFAFGALPGGGPGTVQPSNVSPSASNDVEPAPVETTMSSTMTPPNWNTSSPAWVSDSSTDAPA